MELEHYLLLSQAESWLPLVLPRYAHAQHARAPDGEGSQGQPEDSQEIPTWKGPQLP